MRILFFGGTRFLGRAIVHRLLQEGHSITLLNTGKRPDPFSTHVRRVLGDRRDPEVLEKALAKGEYDAVVDVTAYQEKDTSTALQALQGAIEHFIHISTAAVYLIRDALYPPFREEQFEGRLIPRPAESGSSWLFAYHKRRCEEALHRAWVETRFPFTCLRLPMVLGPADETRRADAYLERLASGGPLLLPDGGLNSWGFLWAEDVAEAVVTNLANTTAYGRSYNLAQRETVTLRQFIELAARLLGVESRLISIPSQWLDAVGLGATFSPFSHPHDVLLDCRAAEEDLLFRATPFVRWMELLVREFMARWSGTVEAFAAARHFELTLAREIYAIRLPSLATAGVSSSS